MEMYIVGCHGSGTLEIKCLYLCRVRPFEDAVNEHDSTSYLCQDEDSSIYLKKGLLTSTDTNVT